MLIAISNIEKLLNATFHHFKDDCNYQNNRVGMLVESEIYTRLGFTRFLLSQFSEGELTKTIYYYDAKDDNEEVIYFPGSSGINSDELIIGLKGLIRTINRSDYAIMTKRYDKVKIALKKAGIEVIEFC